MSITKCLEIAEELAQLNVVRTNVNHNDIFKNLSRNQAITCFSLEVTAQHLFNRDEHSELHITFSHKTHTFTAIFYDDHNNIAEAEDKDIEYAIAHATYYALTT